MHADRQQAATKPMAKEQAPAATDAASLQCAERAKLLGGDPPAGEAHHVEIGDGQMAHTDRVLTRFLERQLEEGADLAAASDLLELTPLGPVPAPAYLARFGCRGLVRRAGQVLEHEDFLVGIHFPEWYLRRFDTARVLSWLEPANVFHPNIRNPYICVGRMEAGTPLVDLLYQLFEIISYHNVEMREPNALNHEACVWARRNVHRFPVDHRPLMRRVHTADDGDPPASRGVKP